MKREFLKELGLEDEQIDKVMAENGKDIEKYKAENEELQTKLTNKEEVIAAANEKISEFEEMDIETIKSEAKNWKSKYEESKAEADKQIRDMKFNAALKESLTEAKVKNTKAVKALLDMDSIKFNDDGITGLKDQIEALKESDSYLFELEEDTKQKPPKILAPGNNKSKGITKDDFLNMSFMERVQFKEENEETYNKLIK